MSLDRNYDWMWGHSLQLLDTLAYFIRGLREQAKVGQRVNTKEEWALMTSILKMVDALKELELKADPSPTGYGHYGPGGQHAQGEVEDRADAPQARALSSEEALQKVLRTTLPEFSASSSAGGCMDLSFEGEAELPDLDAADAEGTLEPSCPEIRFVEPVEYGAGDPEADLPGDGMVQDIDPRLADWLGRPLKGE